MAEHAVTRRRLSHKRAGLVVAVELHISVRFHTAHRQQRGIEVRALEQRFVHRPRLHLARPDHDAGLACAAVIKRCLAAALRQIARRRHVGEAFGVRRLRRIGPAAVVAEEDNDGVVRHARIINGLQDPAHAVIEAAHHGRVERVVLRILRISLGFEVVDVIVPRVPRRMHGIRPVVHIERAALVRFNVPGRFFRHAVFNVLARLAGDGRVLDKLPRCQVPAARARGAGRMREIKVKALVLGLVAVVLVLRQIVTQVPLAEVRGGVPLFVQRFRQREVLRFQPREAAGVQHTKLRIPRLQLLLQPDLRLVTGRCRDARARRVQTGKNAGARGRAQRTGRVGLGELHPPPRQPVNVRRLMIRTAKASHIVSTQVIRQDEDDVGPGGRVNGGHQGQEGCGGGQETGSGFHDRKRGGSDQGATEAFMAAISFSLPVCGRAWASSDRPREPMP